MFYFYLFLGLSIAASKNYFDVLDVLLCDPGLNVNLETSAEAIASDWIEYGNFTPLIIACIEKNPGIVKTLLEQKNIDISYKDKFGRSALHFAASNCASSIKLLAEVPGLDWNGKNHNGETPLYMGLTYGMDGVVETIISLPNIDFSVKTNGGETLATGCVTSEKGENLKCLELLTTVDKIDWNIPGNNGDTPILWCAKNKKIEKFKMLLKCSGFEMNIPEKELAKFVDDLFHHKNIDFIEFLTKNKADSLTVNCMLSVAAMLGHLNAVMALTEHYGSANINMRDKNGNTPFDYAAAGGHLDLVKFFFENGTDINLKSMAAKVFIACCQHNKPKVAKECLDLGVDVNMITNDGRWSGR